jgi:hypothetical protein
MEIVLREVKGTPLTHTEMDNNFRAVENLLNRVDALEKALSEMNLVALYDMQDGNVWGYLDFFGRKIFNTDNEIMYTIDNDVATDHHPDWYSDNDEAYRILDANGEFMNMFLRVSYSYGNARTYYIENSNGNDIATIMPPTSPQVM